MEQHSALADILAIPVKTPCKKSRAPVAQGWVMPDNKPGRETETKIVRKNNLVSLSTCFISPVLDFQSFLKANP